MNTVPPLWTLFFGQLMVGMLTVVCFALVLRRLNEHLKKTVNVAIELLLKQQAMTKLLADELGAHVRAERAAAETASKKFDVLIRDKALDRATER